MKWSVLPLSLVSAALWLSMWVAAGSLALAIADGLGSQPGRRVAVGMALVLGTLAALWQRRRVCAWLRARPWLVIVIGLAELGVAAVDGLIGGPYVAFTLTTVGLAVVVAAPRTVWWCVLVLAVGYAIGVLLSRSPASLADRGELAGVIGQLLSYPFAAGGLLALAALFKRFVTDIEPLLESLRAGAPALTPALMQAIANPGQPLLLDPGRARVRLTPAEIRVVEGIACGSAAKELALQWGVSLATVRTHIRHAKRKTGARTLPELATLVTRPDWPELGDHGA